MATDEIPPGFVKNDDGCICPAKDESKKPRIPKFQTCPYDPRFPNSNQTAHCFYSFIDYQRCARLLGDYPGCYIFYKCYMALCPTAWYEKWFEQMEAGTFPRKIYPSKPIIRPDPNKMGSADLPEDEKPETPVC